jgi:hypothetical protein
MEKKAEGCKVNGAGFRAKRATGSVKELRLRVEVKGASRIAGGKQDFIQGGEND